ncbi:jmjC domain-containing protein 8 isoform X3 [Polyodon spathula]|uniref:jmjC domain-containing protein 8 isoform X3 n=1 Tax=Polyodon spathula TaxID=7913 RepID=UPI001B7ECC0D|nr:jmjC domain-containing protein 8 isoform X3 [Polyodon spathula]
MEEYCCVLLTVACFISLPSVQSENYYAKNALTADGGWLSTRNSSPADEGPCTVEICIFQTCHYPRTYRQHIDVPFQEFVEHLLRPQSLETLGSDTLYFFGDNNFTEWRSLFQNYFPPPYTLPGTSGAYSFGIAGPGTGVPFHWHGPGYSEVIYGRKRWFLYPPEKVPNFHPNKTTLSWVVDTYPALNQEDRPIECTIHPGEVLFFPDRWWHATLNLDTSVFISTFLG